MPTVGKPNVHLRCLESDEEIDKFPNLVVNGQTMSPWTHVRETNSYYSNGPVENVNSIDIRCNERGGRPRAQIATVNAGGTVGFLANPTISHPGPLAFYLAKVPSGQSAADWDGSGNVWFKIYEEQPKFPEFTFASNGAYSRFRFILLFARLTPSPNRQVHCRREAALLTSLGRLPHPRRAHRLAQC